ncbi:short chain dehydrogenase (AtsC) [Apiospora phragmitis]|uniref:Short chain dehydrogenase (AtsC) n=1 Tax=Apiospora phragmitis TaxID=2905665 RepID=A0ABR1UZP8_9PEZI
MPSYVITGVSRGLGYEFLRQLSSDPNDIVIGTVRDKAATLKKMSADADLKDRSNIHLFEVEMTNYEALKRAAEDAAKITGGSLDYLIANAAYVSQFDGYDSIGVLGTNKPQELEEDLKKALNVNVVANIHLYNLFLPLVLRGQAKKVVVISSGMADMDLVNQYEVDMGPLYSISKAAMNMATAKFNAQYKKEGVLFLSMSPGMVDVGHQANLTPDQVAAMQGMVQKFAQYAPRFTGPITPEESVRAMRSVWEKATVEENAGDFISHKGNKQWL